MRRGDWAGIGGNYLGCHGSCRELLLRFPGVEAVAEGVVEGARDRAAGGLAGAEGAEGAVVRCRR